MIEQSFSLVTVVLTFLAGFALGRITAAISDPRRREAARQRRVAAGITSEDNIARLTPEQHAGSNSFC